MAASRSLKARPALHAPPLVTGGSPALVLTRHLLSPGVTDPPASPRVDIGEVRLYLQEDVPWCRTGVICRPAVLRHTPSQHPISSHHLRLRCCSAILPCPVSQLSVLLELGRARFASEEGAPNEDTALTRGGVLTPSEVQLHST